MTAILKNSISALAVEVSTALNAVIESLGDFEDRTAQITAEAWEAYRAASNEGCIDEVNARLADHSLARDLKHAVENVIGAAFNRRNDVSRSVESHEEKHSLIEGESKTRANIEAAKTAEPINSGFNLLSAHVVLQNGKPMPKATVLYTADGVIYEASVYRDTANDEPRIERDYCNKFERVHIRNGSEMTEQYLFWADMSAEEIGKAAHLRREIINAAWGQFCQLPKKRKAA